MLGSRLEEAAALVSLGKRCPSEMLTSVVLGELTPNMEADLHRNGIDTGKRLGFEKHLESCVRDETERSPSPYV